MSKIGITIVTYMQAQVIGLELLCTDLNCSAAELMQALEDGYIVRYNLIENVYVFKLNN